MKVPRLDTTTGEILPSKPYPPRGISKIQLEPVSLPDLMERAGPLSEAARVFVEWGAVTSWQMNSSSAYQGAIAAADIPDRVASLSVLLVREALQHETGWPRIDGKVVTPALYGYSSDAQSEAQRTAEEIRALWDAAGRPHVDARRCKDAYRWLVACNALPGSNAERNPTEVKPGSAADMLQNFLSNI